MKTSLWTDALALAELEPGTMRTLKLAGAQLAVGRDAEGRPFAVDNRCPHEGYPLAQGDLKGCLLTCAWHNWKFDVTDGSCVLGGEAVRAFPVREKGERLEIDLAEPDPAERIPALRASFREGILRHENDRAIRDGLRLFAAGHGPDLLLADVARLDALHAEYGTTHALAVAADCGRLAAGRSGAEAMYALAPAIDYCGEVNRRLPERARPEPLAADASPATGAALRAAVEDEDAARAEGLLRGAFAAGVPRTTVEGWICASLADHFLDFGHPLIYLVKARELLGRIDDPDGAYAEPILGALLHSIVLGTREDTLPYWRPYGRRLEEVEGELARIHAAARPDTPFDPVALRDAVLDGSVADSFDATWGALRAGVPAPTVARALVGAAAHRLHRFDPAVEADPDVAENWLWATHRFTFSSAVRNATERYDTPDALRLVLQAAAWIHQGRPMDLPAAARSVPQVADLSVDEVVAAIAARDTRRVLAGARSLARDPEGVAALRAGVEELCLHDPAVRPIVLAHVIKTAVAGFEEHGALAGHPDREMALLGPLRFLASPVAERNVRGTVHTSIGWVAEGRVPRKLTQ